MWNCGSERSGAGSAPASTAAARSGRRAWYCVLEGTAEGAVAEAQARALTDLLAHYAVGGQREILLAVDEFSAVSRRLPIRRLYERARALGLAVQVSAQSWEGWRRCCLSFSSVLLLVRADRTGFTDIETGMGLRD